MKEKQEILFKRININNIHNARQTAVRFRINEIKENNVKSNSVIISQTISQNYNIKKLTNSELYSKHTVVDRNTIDNKITNKTVNYQTIKSEDELNIMKASINNNEINYNELKNIHKANKDDLLHFQKSINFNKAENNNKLKDINDKKRLKGKVAKIIKNEHTICKKLYNDTLRINNLVALSIAKQIHYRKYKNVKDPPEYDPPDPLSILNKITEFKNENLSQYYYDIDHIKDSLISKKQLLKENLNDIEFNIVRKENKIFGNMYSDKVKGESLLEKIKKEEKESEALKIFNSRGRKQFNSSVSNLSNKSLGERKDFKLENDDSQLNLNHIVKLNDLTYKSMLKDKINTKIMQNKRENELKLKRRKILENISNRLLNDGNIKQRLVYNRKESKEDEKKDLKESQIHLRKRHIIESSRSNDKNQILKSNNKQNVTKILLSPVNNNFSVIKSNRNQKGKVFFESRKSLDLNIEDDNIRTLKVIERLKSNYQKSSFLLGNKI